MIIGTAELGSDGKLDRVYARNFIPATLDSLVADFPYMKQDLTRWGPFDFLIGGSPCNDFSRVNPHREGFTGKWGKLFFDYARILNICRAKHEEDMKTTTPFYWLFENVSLVDDRGVSV